MKFVTYYVPYREYPAPIYRTGLSEERMKELGLTHEDYNPFSEKNNLKLDQYERLDSTNEMIHKSTDPYPTSEIKKAWLLVHPIYNKK